MTEAPENIIAPPPAPKKHRSASEIYESLVSNIQKKYDNQLTDKEAHEAARNLLGFCQKVIEIRSREIK